MKITSIIRGIYLVSISLALQAVAFAFTVSTSAYEAKEITWKRTIYYFDLSVEGNPLSHTDEEYDFEVVGPGSSFSSPPNDYYTSWPWTVIIEYEVVSEITHSMEDFDEPASGTDWLLGSWTPEASLFFQDEYIQQSRTNSRLFKRGKRMTVYGNSYEADVEYYTNYTEEYRWVYGTKPR